MAAVEVEHLTVRYGDVVAVDAISFTAAAGHSHHRARPERRRQDVDDRGLRGLPTGDDGHRSGARPRPGNTPAPAQQTDGSDAARGRRLPRARGSCETVRHYACAVRQRSRRDRAGRSRRADRQEQGNVASGCRVASGNDCRWRWRWPPSPTSRSSTSRRRASTSTVATPSAASSASSRRTDALSCWPRTSSTRPNGSPTGW